MRLLTLDLKRHSWLGGIMIRLYVSELEYYVLDLKSTVERILLTYMRILLTYRYLINYGLSEVLSKNGMFDQPAENELCIPSERGCNSANFSVTYIIIN